ncbi:MAG TPA: hypothetical protein VG432_05285 [Gemmatimonadaceae bacterium]|nr:hypothetical protein [Gemmatimonadaceae bacterium]
MMRIARAAALGARLALAGAAAACGGSKSDDSPFDRPQHSASYRGDSARVVALAVRALGDSLPMRVEAITKGAQGWQVRLLPVRGGTAGGGTVWVEINDSSATVVKRY